MEEMYRCTIVTNRRPPRRSRTSSPNASALPVDAGLAGLDELSRIAGHRVHRRFLPRPVEPALLQLLCACALSAPSKSDLQQADILIVRDQDKQRAIATLITDMPWIADAPVF